MFQFLKSSKPSLANVVLDIALFFIVIGLFSFGTLVFNGSESVDIRLFTAPVAMYLIASALIMIYKLSKVMIKDGGWGVRNSVRAMTIVLSCHIAAFFINMLITKADISSNIGLAISIIVVASSVFYIEHFRRTAFKGLGIN